MRDVTFTDFRSHAKRYFDTSAFIKRYVDEPGSERVVELKGEQI